MFSKFSGWLLSGAALFVLVGVVVGQEVRTASPWPFDRSWFGGNSGNAGANGGAVASDQTPTSDSQTLHSVAVPSGITSPYAKNSGALNRPAQYTPLSNSFMSTAAPGGNAPTLAPPQAAAKSAAAPSAAVPPAATPDQSAGNSTAQSTPSQTATDEAPHDSRPLRERLAAIRAAEQADAEPTSAAPAAGQSSRRRVASADENDEVAPRPAADSPAGDASMQPTLAEEAHEHDAPPAHAAARSETHNVVQKAPGDEPHAAEKPAAEPPAGIDAISSKPLPELAPAADHASGAVLFTRQSPQLSVETAGPRTIVIGREATYTVTMKNSGDVAAQEVIVSVKIPDWTDVAGSQASAGVARQGTAEGEAFQWKLPRLEAHGKESLTLRLIPRKGRAFDLAVQWTFSPIASQTLVEVQEPKLTMSIAGPDEVTFGQSKVYKLMISNPGTGDAENVVVLLAPLGGSAAPPSKHPIGTIRAGDSKTVELELTARQSGTLSIHASATAEPGLKVEAAQEVLVRRAAVAVSIDGAKSKYAGTMAGYTIAIANPGNATADNVHITATLPQGSKFVSASSGGQWKADQSAVVWSLPPLHAGAQAAMEFKCTLTNPGPNRIQVASTSTADVSDTANIITNVEALADLKLEVSDPAGPIGVGDEVVYELKVRNRGTKSAEGIGVVAYFSDGIEPVGATGGAHDIANGVVAFRPLPMLAAGADATFKIRARADRSGKQVFRAEIECGALGTKLVTAEEVQVYGADDVPGLMRSEKQIATRPSPLTPVPDHGEQPDPSIRR